MPLLMLMSLGREAMGFHPLWAIAGRLTNLTKLDLWGNQIGEASQLKLKQKLPNCSITF